MTVRGLLWSAGLVLLAACASRPAAGPAPAGAAPTADTSRIEGVVSVVGSAPLNVRVNVTPAGGRPVTVTGPLAQEIRRLGGARVAVRGRRDAAATIEASDYDVLSVDGRPVTAGVVERSPDGGVQLRLRDGSTVALAGGAAALRPGQKVWVQGPATVTVQSFGVISP